MGRSCTGPETRRERVSEFTPTGKEIITGVWELSQFNSRASEGVGAGAGHREMLLFVNVVICGCLCEFVLRD